MREHNVAHNWTSHAIGLYNLTCSARCALAFFRLIRIALFKLLSVTLRLFSSALSTKLNINNLLIYVFNFSV